MPVVAVKIFQGVLTEQRNNVNLAVLEEILLETNLCPVMIMQLTWSTISFREQDFTAAL